MATCPNCHSPQPEGAIFCDRCGSMISTANTNNVPLEPPLITKLRGVGASGGMLALAIVYTVLLVLSLFNSCIQFLQGSFTVPVGGIIVCIALWCIYATAKKPVGSLVSTGGVTALFVLEILEIILVSLCGVLLLVVFALVGIMGGFARMSEEFGAQGDTVMLILGITFGVLFLMVALIILIDVLALRFYSSVRNTLRSGFPYCKAAVPLGVLFLLGGVYSLAMGGAQVFFAPMIDMIYEGIFQALETLIASTEGDIRMDPNLTSALPETVSWIISGITSAVGGLGQILAAVMVFKYRKAVKE